MRIEYAQAFEKDLKRINNKKILLKFRSIIQELEKATNVFEVNKVNKIIGSKNAYRVKINDYRAGFYIIDNRILFKRFLDRKDIYKYFPSF